MPPCLGLDLEPNLRSGFGFRFGGQLWVQTGPRCGLRFGTQMLSPKFGQGQGPSSGTRDQVLGSLPRNPLGVPPGGSFHRDFPQTRKPLGPTPGPLGGLPIVLWWAAWLAPHAGPTSWCASAISRKAGAQLARHCLGGVFCRFCLHMTS